VGTVEPRKNVQALIDAYLELSRSHPTVPPLVFAGRVEGAAPPSPPGVRYLGYVSDDAREQLYREASLLVVPSLDEGFGIPVLEAMTAGVPVVAADRGALPEVLGDAGLLVSGEGPEFTRSLATAIARVLDDGDLRREFAARGVARARSFSWDQSAKRAREALAEAVARRTARR
jgi:glycosyltransferase involved in cell wall biosynthesis